LVGLPGLEPGTRPL